MGYHRKRVLFLGGEYILTRPAEKLAQFCRYSPANRWLYENIIFS